MQDRAIRTLVRLQESGSTARVLNLVRLHHQHRDDPGHAAAPLFRCPVLKKAIIAKHRPKPHEQELFDGRRLDATKLILPIDSGDLRIGGRFAFVGQRGWEALFASLSGEHAAMADDRRTLELLDAAPSFDPFLLREHLRRGEVAPASTYFDIAPADTERMYDFLEIELRPLAMLIARGDEANLGGATAQLVSKLMGPGAEEALETLGRVLRLTPSEYAEGVFCWKGFLYYKWRFSQHQAEAGALSERIAAARPSGSLDASQKAALAEAKRKVMRGLAACRTGAGQLLAVYDGAFNLMVMAEDPTGFREFLLDAPGLFVRLGDLFGALDHVEGYWAFRFGPGARANADADELIEILEDFDEALGGFSAKSVQMAS